MSDILLSLLLAASPPACDPMPGWQELASEADGKYLIFGELHGTVEAPLAVGEYVCAAAQQGPVLLAIEFSATSNDAFQRAWSAPPEKFRETVFRELPQWGKRNDGVASEAMLAMLQRLHLLKSSGRRIDIVAFNGAKNDTQRAAFADLPGQEPHEAAQAANIRIASMAADYRHVVILAGGLHAKKSPSTIRAVEMRPMAMMLSYPQQVVSLRMHSTGGEAWYCTLREDVQLKPDTAVTHELLDCSGHKEKASSTYLERGFYIDKSVYPDAFDGVFELGRITASPPPSKD